MDAATQERCDDRFEELMRYEAWKDRNGKLREKQQLEPPFPSDVVIVTGVGWGKGEMVIRHLRDRIDNYGLMSLLIAGPTFNLTMSNMVRGNVLAPGFMLAWPKHMAPTLHLGDEPYMICHTGCKIYIRTLQKPDQARGVNAQGIWLDEVDSAHPERMTVDEALETFDARSRLPGKTEPFRIYSTTPKASRGGRLARKLSGRPGIHLVTGSSYENTNLPEAYFEKVLRPLEGTRRGQEEVRGLILDNVIGALVDAELHIDPARRWTLPENTIVRTAVGVDPSGGGDEIGIVAAGVSAGAMPHGWVLEDASGHYTPSGWGDKVVDVALKWDAVVVVERNFGGDMAQDVVSQAATRRNARIRIKMVTASKAKHVRASAVTPFYEHCEVHHLGNMPELEAQVCAFTDEKYDGEGSPDRADALFWALMELLPIRTKGFDMLSLLTDDERAEAARRAA